MNNFSGGFVATQMQGTAGGGVGDDSDRFKGNIVPVSTAILAKSSATSDGFTFEGVVIKECYLVGRPLRVTMHATRIDFELDDGSGFLAPCTQFTDVDDSEADRAVLDSAPFVKVFVRPRLQQNKRIFTVLKVFPLAHLSEIRTHVLETVFAWTVLKNKLSGTGEYQANGGAFSSGATIGGGGGGAMSSMQENGLSPIHNEILSLLHTCRTSDGMAKSEIFSKLKQYNGRALQDALSFLQIEGHIYSAIDDEHFLASMNN